MSAHTNNPALADHLAWLGYVQPEGLVVSAPALVDAQAIIDRAQLGELQRRFIEYVSDVQVSASNPAETQPGIKQLPRLLTEFLGWLPELVCGLDPARPVPDELVVSLPEFNEALQPTFAVKNPKAKEGALPWLLLVQSHPSTVDLDKPITGTERHWNATPARKFERLLRETGVPIGLVTNGTSFRLVYAPPKENSGAITFHVGPMAEVSGRLILGAFQLLLGSWTLFTAPSEARLPALLQRSREYQASVSEILAEQVLHALYELLRGVEAADERVGGTLLRELAAKNPADIYGGLVTVLLRLVFILFAEDRGLLPESALYVRYYAVHGLFEKLRANAERYPDTMDHRFGAWAQLLALFRLIHGGCKHPELQMPARAGHLFDPDRYPFLEGRASARAPLGALPLVSDGTLYRILDKLCLLKGERVSYRTLDVEEIGSVYQTIMGFGVETATGTAIALKGKRKNGGVPASPVIYLEQLLASPAKDRAKWLKEQADTELTGEPDKRLKSAATVEDLLVALEKRIDLNATPARVNSGGLVLQPTDERRRSGSHYTPRSFTEPIVRKTLEPILKNLRSSRREEAQIKSPSRTTDSANPDQSLVTSAATNEVPTPDQVLGLKICDIAVGSAAFLVETARQLADVLVRAWRTHGGRPPLPPDETEELLAMRLITQRCLYGVDRNPMAVDLAKLSLWLATLAKDHPFTFLDHAIRCGDSLVGLTRRQIETFTWKSEFTTGQLWEQEVRKRSDGALRERQNLLGMGDDYGTPALKRAKLGKADELLDLVRFIGDAAVAAFFSEDKDKDKAREAKRVELAERIADYLGKGDLKQRPTAEVKVLRSGKFPVEPFHWEIEFPEVFGRENPGFDAVVGNPPFMGGMIISNALGNSYKHWLYACFSESGDRMDIVGYFFRRAFMLLRQFGTFGLIATNTIAQGDTRSGGLRFICINGGTVYEAHRRCKWPGQAAVVVSVVHIAKCRIAGPYKLDGRQVQLITAYLFHSGGSDDPAILSTNRGKCFVGSNILGMGFTFDDTDRKGVASSLDDMARLVTKDPHNSERIFPFIGGEELNDSPIHAHHRYVINFGEMSEQEARSWPDLVRIVEQKVKPERDGKEGNYSRQWWLFGRRNQDGQRALQGLPQVLANSQVSQHLTFAFLPNKLVYAHTLNVYAISSYAFFATLQARVHETWVRFFASSLEERLRYTSSDCFETFPFPEEFETNLALETIGKEYYYFRAALMQNLWLGLTEIYNVFHSPDGEALARLETLYRKRAANTEWRTEETVPADRSPLTLYPTPAAALAGIRRLRELHAAMDAAVLTAYGWTDLLPQCTCEFLLDYEDEESETGTEETTGRKKKKPWRYRWPDEVRDEVLARLLKLNAERAEQERLAGQAAAATGNSTTKSRKPRRSPKPGITSTQGDLIEPPQRDLFA